MSMELQLVKLYNKALRQVPNSPQQLETLRLIEKIRIIFNDEVRV